MPPSKKDRVFFSIDENADGIIQLSINCGSVGYRICGPKYDGRGRTIRKHIVTLRDVEELMPMLRAARSVLKEARDE